MANSTESYPVIHPGTGLVVHRVTAAGVQDVDDAIASCHAAWESWSRRSIKDRRAVALRSVQLLRDPSTGWSQRLLEGNLKETDVSPFWANAQVDGAADAIEEIACSMQEALKGEYIALSDSKSVLCFVRGHGRLTIPRLSGHAVLVSREPMGVCLAIPAWNAVSPLTT
jgi:succinate-semialdehyde dehydrogenase / glutarate-semialdehyde dehydrogenase